MISQKTSQTGGTDDDNHGGHPDWFVRELRSDHAGETGAVWIYRGVLSVSRDEVVRDFANRHLKTERHHLSLMNDLLPPAQRSRLLPLWKMFGYFTGAIPAVFGRRLVFLTINAVETFVEKHYCAQITRLHKDRHTELAATLETCMQDEVNHKLEASQLMGHDKGPLYRCVHWLIGSGSALAVAAARRF